MPNLRRKFGHFQKQFGNIRKISVITPLLAQTDVARSDEPCNKVLRAQCRHKECSVLIACMVPMFTLNNNVVNLIHKDAKKKTNVGTFTTRAAYLQYVCVSLCVCVCVCVFACSARLIFPVLSVLRK